MWPVMEFKGLVEMVDRQLMRLCGLDMSSATLRAIYIYQVITHIEFERLTFPRE